MQKNLRKFANIFGLAIFAKKTLLQMIQISKNIAVLMASRGLNQTELARRVGMSQANLNAAINAENPTIKTLQKIADGLNCTIIDLLKENNANTTTTNTICPHCGHLLNITIQ